MIYFVGDINLTDWNFSVGFGTGTKIKNGFNPFKFLNKKKKDIWVGNFEGVASTTSPHKGMYANAFRIDPKALLKINHMDIYGFANNHAMEHGPMAYIETVKTLESFGSKVFGIRDNKSYVFEHESQKISISGMCTRIEATKWEPLYWYNPDYKEIIEELNCLPKDAFKILYIHWGNEFINRPSSIQKKFAHWLIDIGYDLVIGMHPHVLQGYEDYNGGRIYYSLGNFVFEMPSEQCLIGAIVGIDFNGDKAVYSEQYVKIDNDGFPHIVSKDKIPYHWQFYYLNERLLIDDNTEEYHREINDGYLVYRKENRKKILISALHHPCAFCDVLIDFIKRKLNK